MRRVQGQTTFCGAVAYLPQTPWIMNANLRDNIIFGYDYDETKFKKVVAACQLEPDIAILPNRELTEIGEKGISLSGESSQSTLSLRNELNCFRIRLTRRWHKGKPHPQLVLSIVTQSQN